MNRKIEPATIARTAVLLFALANQLLSMTGWNPLPFEEQDIYLGVTTFVTAAASLWSWWKNNSFTQPALEGDEYKNEIRNMKNHVKNQ